MCSSSVWGSYERSIERMHERDFQSGLKRTISALYPDAYILKTVPHQYQGIPDLVIVYHGKAAFLECKASPDASYRMNQEWRIAQIRKEGGFAASINPKNKDTVLHELYMYLNGEV